tara:strand:+ start:1060 stop:1317 length:258 start_codon:yes stop_codon:yes gene_type:complete
MVKRSSIFSPGAVIKYGHHGFAYNSISKWKKICPIFVREMNSTELLKIYFLDYISWKNDVRCLLEHQFQIETPTFVYLKSTVIFK